MDDDATKRWALYQALADVEELPRLREMVREAVRVYRSGSPERLDGVMAMLAVQIDYEEDE